MKVKDLMTRLSEMPPEAPVCFWYDGGTLDADCCHLSRDGRVVIDKEDSYLYDEEDSGEGWVYSTCRWEPK